MNSVDLNDDKTVFDLSGAMEIVSEDKELFVEITRIFFREYPEAIKDIKKAILEADSHSLELTAHKLKGSVANLGAKRSYDAAYRLELIGKKGELQDAVDAADLLDREIKLLNFALDKAVKEIKGEDSEL